MIKKMNLNNISIGTRLAAGFCLLILITTIAGLFAIFQVLSLAEITTKIYNHPLVVSSADTVIHEYRDAL